jgi:hypothetical protein
MRVILAGPDDLGYWFLVDDAGNTFPLVQDDEEHMQAAALFGWVEPAGLAESQEIIDDAIDWLMEHIGEEIDAPMHVERFFLDLYQEERE